jgi:putative protein-disulfide isomerase
MRSDMPLLIYIYDAYCGWCYGFSPVISKIAEEFKDRLQFEVLSGGMILPDKPVHIGAMAGYIAQAYKTVEEKAGVEFGKDYLWHIFNPEESDWYPHSEKPAISLCILKQLLPESVIEIASDIQQALHFDGRDLTDDEAYRHILEKYDIEAGEFYEKLKSEEYRQMAYDEFSLVQQFQVRGFPAVYLQTEEGKFYQLAEGYTNSQDISDKLEQLLITIK